MAPPRRPAAAPHQHSPRGLAGHNRDGAAEGDGERERLDIAAKSEADRSIAQAHGLTRQAPAFRAIVVLAGGGRHDRPLFAPARQGGTMKSAIPLCFAAVVLAGPAAAKDTRFWNLTSSTVKSLELAPAGTSAFGPNQCANDPDGAVDHDERVKVTGVTTGAYDARLTLTDGRVCMAKAVRIEAGKPFAIEDKDLVGCSR
jgi:hypothetical protein